MGGPVDWRSLPARLHFLQLSQPRVRIDPQISAVIVKRHVTAYPVALFAGRHAVFNRHVAAIRRKLDVIVCQPQRAVTERFGAIEATTILHPCQTVAYRAVNDACEKCSLTH